MSVPDPLLERSAHSGLIPVAELNYFDGTAAVLCFPSTSPTVATFT